MNGFDGMVASLAASTPRNSNENLAEDGEERHAGRSPQSSTRVPGQSISSGTAAAMAEMMANNVEKTYGTGRFPNMDLCAKSGTAEVGEGKTPHAWFAGFLRGEDTPYAFVVLVENGGGGSSVAGTVAGKVLDLVVNGY